MIQLWETGVYLVNGTELVADNAEAAAAVKAKTGKEADQTSASKETIAYVCRDYTDSACIWAYKVSGAVHIDKLS